MSELYSVTVRKVDGANVSFRVTVVHPDAGPVPDDAFFALQVVYDPIDPYNHGKDPKVGGCALAQEMDLNDYLSPPWVRANALGFVASVRVVDGKNHPPPSYDDDGYEAFWERGETSRATLHVTMTHPAWAEHLRPGMSWSTAAYGDRVDPWTRPPRRPGDRRRVRSDDPMEGMRPGAKNDDNAWMLESAQVSEFTLPLHGPSNYEVAERLEGDAMTVEALRALLGEPVLVQERGGRLEARALVAVADDGAVSTYYESDGSSGGGTTGRDGIAWIGRAWFVRREWVDG